MAEDVVKKPRRVAITDHQAATHLEELEKASLKVIMSGGTHLTMSAEETYEAIRWARLRAGGTW